MHAGMRWSFNLTCKQHFAPPSPHPAGLPRPRLDRGSGTLPGAGNPAGHQNCLGWRRTLPGCREPCWASQQPGGDGTLPGIRTAREGRNPAGTRTPRAGGEPCRGAENPAGVQGTLPGITTARGGTEPCRHHNSPGAENPAGTRTPRAGQNPASIRTSRVGQNPADTRTAATTAPVGPAAFPRSVPVFTCCSQVPEPLAAASPRAVSIHPGIPARETLPESPPHAAQTLSIPR